MAVTASSGVGQRDRRDRFFYFRHPRKTYKLLAMSKRYNICLPVNKSNQQTTLSHETGIFRGKLAKFAGKMLAQREIMRTFVVLELHIGTANKQVKEIEGIGSSIIIRSYILDMCDSDKLDYVGLLFYLIHLIVGVR